MSEVDQDKGASPHLLPVTRSSAPDEDEEEEEEEV